MSVADVVYFLHAEQLLFPDKLVMNKLFKDKTCQTSWNYLCLNIFLISVSTAIMSQCYIDTK